MVFRDCSGKTFPLLGFDTNHVIFSLANRVEVAVVYAIAASLTTTAAAALAWPFTPLPRATHFLVLFFSCGLP